jgi:predicted transcriptional regulator
MELTLDKDSLAVYKALASDTRLEILDLLAENPRTATELAESLKLSKAVLSRHITQLEKVGLIRLSKSKRSDDNRKKVYALNVDHADIVFPHKVYFPFLKRTHDIELGYFSDFLTKPTCGLADSNHVIGKIDDERSFVSKERIQATLLWVSQGYVEYKIPNLLESGEQPQMLELSLEISSEYPVSNNAWPSDITFTVNDKQVGTWTCPGNYSDVRGKLTPSWWNENFSQYGLLKYLRVNQYGTSIDGDRISDISIEDLHLDDSPFLKLRIGVLPEAKNQGGLTIFGRDFGNHPQDITLSLYYSNPESLAANQ